MSSVRQIHDDVVVVGWSCRLPGANSIPALWSLLLERRCAIGRVPDDRFMLARYGHPRRNERGRSYTWAAGVLDDIWGFDPAVFGISPRESEQMDPQQRILLQLAWEALEDAGIPPSALAGSDVGVFVGGSSLEYSNHAFVDPAVADGHFATGNALAVLSNRISYVFDLRGPSVTVDTACSSSLVALHQAAEAIRTGRVDTAIVGGINVIASYSSFITFSQAGMLSPTGLCRAFDAKADGFVRAEGGVVLVLRRAALAYSNGNPVHGIILASDVNSDGRTNGIALPSPEAQENLLTRIYSRAGIAPSRLAFVEAHGTGTPVGDPIEAGAIGRSLSHERAEPLLIGSIKTNIGHLEPASGLAGVLKALLALNHGVLPPSLHFTEPNPRIDFARLNLAVCDRTQLLANDGQECAGVNSFGFGGTNAHAVVAAGRAPPEAQAKRRSGEARYLMISAETKPALAALARDYSGRVAASSAERAPALAAAAAHRRERLSTRLVVTTVERDGLLEALDAFVADADHGAITTGAAVGRNLLPAFVYSGNGSQWVGMGVAAYRRNATFRARFDDVDGRFRALSGWSLKEALLSGRLAERIDLTSVAQPLIFAIQSAATAALRALGLRPAAVLGHSVGEIAAAEAAGILDLGSAVRVIFHRSRQQETVRGTGGMAVLVAAPDAAAELAAELGDVEVAAINSPRTITMVGTTEGLARLKALADTRNIPFLDLGLPYPFHSSLMEPIAGELAAGLGSLEPRDGEIPFISTVMGACVVGAQLGADYWWRNVREPVQFLAAVRETAKFGARYFVEIGPSPILLKHIGETLAGEITGWATLGVLDRKEPVGDPFDKVVARALVAGARIEDAAVFGADPGGAVALPSYPWQQTPFRYGKTSEAVGPIETDRHPLAGVRMTADALAWYADIDTAVMPELADHRLGEQAILPATGFLEIAFNVAQEWLRADKVTLANVELLRPLDLTSGETREVITRVSPGSGTFEISSRPRLSRAGWILHCRGKILHAGSAPTAIQGPDRPRVAADKAGLYAIAAASGLNYGPAFRQVDQVLVDEGWNTIEVALEPAHGRAQHLLDPMRLDCCIQGLIATFPQLEAAQRGVAYIPVRIDEASLYVPRALPQEACFRLRSRNDRAVVGDGTVLAADGAVIASFRGARCQAVPVRRTSALDAVAAVELLQPADGSILGTTGVGAEAADVLAAASEAGLTRGPERLGKDAQLFEGWATAAGYEIARSLGRRGSIDPVALSESGRMPAAMRPWLTNILRNLEAAGLAHEEGGRWKLLADQSLPHSRSVLDAIAREFPWRASECLLAAEISAMAGAPAADDGARTEPAFAITPSALEYFALTNRTSAQAGVMLARLVAETKALLPPDRVVRILQLGAGALSSELAGLASAGRAQLTVFEPDMARRERAQATLLRNANISLTGGDGAAELGQYDLILAADGLSRMPLALTPARLRGALAHQGLLLAIEPNPSLFRDLVFGLTPDWFTEGLADFPTGRLRTREEWRSALVDAGFEAPHAEAIACGSDLATLLVGAAPAARAVAAPERDGELRVRLAVDGADARDHAFAASLARYFAEAGVTVATGSREPAVTSKRQGAAELMVQIVGSGGDQRQAVEQITARCLALKAAAEGVGGARAALWLVFRGALTCGRDPIEPSARSAWAFSRALVNELPQLDVRRIDLAPDLPPNVAAERVRDVILSGTAESELHIDSQSLHVVRADTVRRVAETGNGKVRTARLQRRQGSGQRLEWQAALRTAPGPGEVEIAVAATGLNFRDLMWMMSLLPDDMLEDGFTGPTLGLECAGRVTRVGSGVADLQKGDRVVALAAGAFATHVTAPAPQVAKLPARLSLEAAATIPVAFITAYYSLVTKAQLKRGEWVLIHGGAGAVGMAAIQVAKLRGAKVIATAGSPAKRSLLKVLGARHVLDSRSLAFVESVRKITGDGVDVVLNSLAGEAMERSLACLRSFGRFVEIGKRDYASDTHLGLRPFRKNLTYFGVDVDQLVGHGPAARKVFDEVMAHFVNGTFAPLPYSIFAADQIAAAFHLMQQSAHIGKIVVRPPEPGTVRRPARPLRISGSRTHLVTGGFSGLGLETARWLVEQGARHLVLMGRRGPSGEAAKTALAEFAARGVKVMSRPCDVADGDALERLFEEMGAAMPPLAGVIHSAMVLDDALLANLDAERMRRVLEPKVKGADNLDRLTRGMPLDYFVLYTSVATLIGNPGQGNYVAANAYLEGLARRRRQQGLPALAIGWGPISDVGVVARTKGLQAGLEKMTGAKAMTAREALGYLAQAITDSKHAPELAAIIVAPNDGSFRADRLAVLRSPTYAALVSAGAAREDEDVAALDIRALVAAEEPEVARRKIGDAIAVQLARVLRTRPEDINWTRPLGEIGLDSLMALELGMTLEKAFSTQIALQGSAGELTIADLTEEVLAQAAGDNVARGHAAAPFVSQHAGAVDPANLETVTKLVETERRARRAIS